MAGVAAVAEHSIVRRYATGRPDAGDRAQLSQMGREIAKRLRANATPGKVTLPGKRPYKKEFSMSLAPAAAFAPSDARLRSSTTPTRAW